MLFVSIYFRCTASNLKLSSGVRRLHLAGTFLTLDKSFSYFAILTTRFVQDEVSVHALCGSITLP